MDACRTFGARSARRPLNSQDAGRFASIKGVRRWVRARPAWRPPRRQQPEQHHAGEHRGDEETTAHGPKDRAVNAGPGQRPARPQPTPKIAAPAMRRGSRSRRVGISSRGASTGRPLRRATTKPTAETATAPAITKARLGSQFPKTSRKAEHLGGLAICETTSPTPNRRPEAKADRDQRHRSAPQEMTRDEDGRDGGRHEHRGRGERPRRAAPDAAHAVAARAAGAEARAEADEEPGGHENGRRARRARRRERAAEAARRAARRRARPGTRRAKRLRRERATGARRRCR